MKLACFSSRSIISFFDSFRAIFILDSIVVLNFGLISYPIEFLLVHIAAIVVVPVPRKGSRIVPPWIEYMLMSLYANLRRYAAALLSR